MDVIGVESLARLEYVWQRVFAEAAIHRHAPGHYVFIDVVTDGRDRTACIARLEVEGAIRYTVWTLGVDPEPLFMSDRGTLNHGRYDIGDLETAAAEAKYRVGR